MNTNLTLDDLILQYSENPFIDKNFFNFPANTDKKEKRSILNRLLLMATNLFSSKEEAKPEIYKRRYEYEIKQ